MSQYISVNNIFHSIQGSGKYMGHPAIFVRLTGCVAPLCPFCDEPSAQTAGTPFTILQLQQKIEEYSCKYVIFTGGEPVLQADELAPLFIWLDRYDYTVGWEVSLKAYSKIFIQRWADRVTICPKYIDGCWQIHDGWKDKWGRINLVSRSFRDISWKFLIKDWADYNLCRNFMSCNWIQPENVWLMPYGADRETSIENTKRVIEIAKMTGYKVAPRLHILIYDKQKGV